MIKNILKLKGATLLNREEQKNVNGAYGTITICLVPYKVGYTGPCEMMPPITSYPMPEL
jgi:hypothetical protein